MKIRQIPIYQSLFAICLIIVTPTFFWSSNPSLEHWGVTELLINYQGGFVRRGLIGEITYQLSSTGQMQLKMLSLCFFVLFLTILYFLYKLLEQYKNQKIIVALILLSPSLFLFPFYDTGGYFRKEAFELMVLFAHAYWVKFNLDKNQNEKKEYRYILILFSALFICMLIHELQFFLIPIHALITYNYYQNKKLGPFLPVFLYILIIASTLIPLIYHGNPLVAQTILDSYQDRFEFDSLKINAIHAVGWSTADTYKTAAKVYKDPLSVLYWSVSFILAAIPLLILAIKILKTRVYLKSYSKLTFFLAISTGFISISPLFYIGCDYGRWIHIGGMSTLAFLLSFNLGRVRNLNITNRKFFKVSSNVIGKNSILLLIFLYIIGWQMPHCCNISQLMHGELYNKLTWYLHFFYSFIARASKFIF
jgi:hypothetical protein